MVYSNSNDPSEGQINLCVKDFPNPTKGIYYLNATMPLFTQILVFIKNNKWLIWPCKYNDKFFYISVL